jgi:TolB-like protein
MASILPGYEYDIFISYRQRDNKGERWVTEFVSALRTEIEATFKEDISVYFDENPTDGLLENNQVDESLSRKLKCLIFIPIISQTYCDKKSFAWEHEFLAFKNFASADAFGLKVNLPNGNVSSRILPVKIHEIEQSDKHLLERELGGVLRSIDFIYKSPGVNRPLSIHDNDGSGNLNYKNQVNKVANAIKGIVDGLKTAQPSGAFQSEIVQESKPGIGREIKDKDLVRVGLVYSICALVLWKVIDLSIRILTLDEKLSDITALALLVLFPIAVLLAWKFEKAPTGFILSSSAAARNNPYTAKQKKPLTSNTSILSLMVIVLILYFVPQRFFPASHARSVSEAATNKSIAVLYFDNMSGDPTQEYLSDGLTEEIITRLTKITGLRVVSRTSVSVYKGKPKNLKQIAKDLNVSAILEGSVRRSGDKLRVVAQLIDAKTDEHLWADTYDREITDVFTVQAEIAEVIADRFQIQMTPEVNLKVHEISTKSSAAYEAYLRARHIAFNQYYYQYDTIAYKRAKDLYELAIKLDSTFALAYAGLADLFDASIGRPEFTPELDSLRHSLSWKAYQLNPNSGFVNNVRIWALLNNRKIPLVDSALFHARKAIRLEPNDFYNWQSMADVLSQFGLEDLAIPFYERAMAMNPSDPRIRTQLGFCYETIGKGDKAIEQFEAAYQLAPETRFLGTTGLMFNLAYHNRLVEAEQLRNRIIEKYKMEPDAFNGTRVLIAVKRARSREEAVKAIEKAKHWAVRGTCFSVLGMRKEALAEWMNIPDDASNFLNLKHQSVFTLVQDDPEFQKLVARKKVIYEERRKQWGQYYNDFAMN